MASSPDRVGNDTIVGTTGDDPLDGNGGNDSLIGGTGAGPLDCASTNAPIEGVGNDLYPADRARSDDAAVPGLADHVTPGPYVFSSWPTRGSTDKAPTPRSRQVAVVFGGAGFVGTHLINSLVASGDYAKIVCADLTLPGKRVPGVRYVTCDVRKPIDIAEEGISEIYNLAAVHTTPGHEDYEYYETNVLGAIHVNDFAAANNVPLIIFTSSISVYGPTEIAKNENSALKPISAYGRSKIMAEKIHASWRNAQPARRLIIVRPAVIYGPGEGGNFTRLANSLKRGWFFYPGRKDTVKACGYVGELINTLAFAKALGRHDVLYNFCYPESYTIEHICEVFHKCGQAKKPMGIVPAWLLLTAARSFEILNSLGLKNSVNRARVRKLMESTFITPQFLLDNRYEFKTDLEDSLHHWRETNPVGELV